MRLVPDGGGGLVEPGSLYRDGLWATDRPDRPTAFLHLLQLFPKSCSAIAPAKNGISAAKKLTFF